MDPCLLNSGMMKVKVQSLRSGVYTGALHPLTSDHYLPWSKNTCLKNCLSMRRIQHTHHTSMWAVWATETVFIPPGTHHCGRDSMEWEVCLTLLHMPSSGNQTPDLLILSPLSYYLASCSHIDIKKPWKPVLQERVMTTLMKTNCIIWSAHIDSCWLWRWCIFIAFMCENKLVIGIIWNINAPLFSWFPLGTIKLAL